MKKLEIVVGGVYSDGKKGVRKVIAFGGEEFKLYHQQACLENLQYEKIKSRKQKSCG